MSSASAPFRPRSGQLGKCIVCARELPLRAARGDETTETWCCAGCGTTYPGVWWEEAPEEIQGNVRSLTAVMEAARARPVCETLNKAPGVAREALEPRANIFCPIQTALSRMFDELIDAGEGMTVEPTDSPHSARLTLRGAEPYDARQADEMANHLEQASVQMEELFSCLDQSRPVDVRTAEQMVRDSLERMTDDFDLFAVLGLQGPEKGYLGRHGTHVAMLAVAIGTTLGWDEKHLMDLGLGCVLHDLGMLRVDSSLYSGQRVLNPRDFIEITKHPIYTFNLLVQHLDKVPVAARMVAYQIHERCDGSGYPRGREGAQIHPLAKVGGVADAFVALTSPRPHRAAMMPYYAMESLLQGTRDGLFDPVAVRALLRTTSLFPLGSFVALSDGRTARVIRANGDHYTRPIVEIVPTPEGATPEIIDLAHAPELSVKSAVPTASAV